LIAWGRSADGKDVVSVRGTRLPYPKGFRREAVALIRSGIDHDVAESLGFFHGTFATGASRSRSTPAAGGVDR
jgi:hypothetical protein